MSSELINLIGIINTNEPQWKNDFISMSNVQQPDNNISTSVIDISQNTGVAVSSKKHVCTHANCTHITEV